jgi:hypothetical protein
LPIRASLLLPFQFLPCHLCLPKLQFTLRSWSSSWRSCAHLFML